jgi:hypothetical protein
MNLEDIEKNLEGLTMNVLDAMMDEFPRHYQCHTEGVSSCIGQLLHKVARVVACYSEQHP